MMGAFLYVYKLVPKIQVANGYKVYSIAIYAQWWNIRRVYSNM